MARILLGVTGSVAAIRAFDLIECLSLAGHDLKVVLTESAKYFLDIQKLAGDPRVLGVFRDADEWPAPGYRRGDQVLHITLRGWADVFVVAPLDAHTLAKFALGLSDNLLTCIFRAWDFERSVVLAPAMNTLMWESPVTRRHLAQLLEDRGTSSPPPVWTLNEAADVFVRHAPSLVLVPPQAKRLACGDIGMGAMADVSQIAQAVLTWNQMVGSL